MYTDSPDTPVAVVAGGAPSTRERRRLIGAGLLGLAGSLVPRLAGSASATAPDDTATDGTASGKPATTSTTTPPKQPVPDDVPLLGFAQAIELGAVELYGIALGSGALSDEVTTVLTSIHKSHVSYGQAINALLGRKAPGESLADVVDSFGTAFGGDEAAILGAAYQLEDTAVATYDQLVGEILGTDGAQLIAAIAVTEARHATVLADLVGDDDLDSLLLTNADALELPEG